MGPFRRTVLLVAASIVVLGLGTPSARADDLCPGTTIDVNGVVTIDLGSGGSGTTYQHTPVTIPTARQLVTMCGSQFAAMSRLVIREALTYSELVVKVDPTAPLLVPVEFDGSAAPHPPDIHVRAAKGLPASYPTPALTEDGLDLTGDGATDVVVHDVHIGRLVVDGPFDPRRMTFDTSRSTTRYDKLFVNVMSSRTRHDVTITAPGSHVYYQSSEAGGRVEVAAADTADFAGSPRDDTFIARGVLHGGTEHPGGGSDRMLLGPGPDFVQSGRKTNGGGYFDLGAGNDKVLLQSHHGSSTVIGGRGNDSIFVNADVGRTRVYGGAGNDSLTIGFPAVPAWAYVYGGPGNDQVATAGHQGGTIFAQHARVDCGTGRDVYFAWEFVAPIGCERLHQFHYR